MADITTPVEGFTGHVAGVDFVKGEGSTDDENAISYFERHGYGVSGKPEPKVVLPEGEPNEKWKVDQLVAYAAEKEIDLGEAKKKDDILAAIELAAEASKPPTA